MFTHTDTRSHAGWFYVFARMRGENLSYLFVRLGTLICPFLLGVLFCLYVHKIRRRPFRMCKYSGLGLVVTVIAATAVAAALLPTPPDPGRTRPGTVEPIASRAVRVLRGSSKLVKSCSLAMRLAPCGNLKRSSTRAVASPPIPIAHAESPCVSKKRRYSLASSSQIIVLRNSCMFLSSDCLEAKTSSSSGFPSEALGA